MTMCVECDVKAYSDRLTVSRATEVFQLDCVYSLQHTAITASVRQRTDDVESDAAKSAEFISRCSSFILHVFDDPASLFSSFNSCCNKHHL